MRLYFAHPVSDYDTPREVQGHRIILQSGFAVLNPNVPMHDRAYKRQGWAYFQELAKGCDGVAFMRFEDGSIGAGVADEVNVAHVAGKPIYEIVTIPGVPDGLYRLRATELPLVDGVLTIEETRAKIREARAA